MKVIKAQKIPRKSITPQDLLASFCYHYQQYTFNQARKMPYKRIIQMLKVARKEEARKFAELVVIVAAPHSSKGKNIKSLLDKYNAIINE